MGNPLKHIQFCLLKRNVNFIVPAGGNETMFGTTCVHREFFSISSFVKDIDITK